MPEPTSPEPRLQPPAQRARGGIQGATATRSLVTGFVLTAIGFAFSIIIGDSHAGWWMIALFATSATTAFVLWKQTTWSDDWTKYLSFGAVLLFACIANRMLYAADVIIAGDRTSEWPFFAAAPEMATRKGEVATIIGTIITFVTWRRVGGHTYSPGAVLRTSNGMFVRSLIMSYLLAVVGVLATSFFPDVTQATGQLVPTMLGLGVAAAFLLPFVLVRGGVARLLIVCLITSPFVYAALGTGMKENIIIALLPIGYLIWNSTRRVLVRVVFLTVAFVGLALVTSYVGYFRAEVWQNKRALDQRAAMGEFVARAKSDGLVSTVSDGLEGFLERSNAASYRGWAIALADEYREEPELVFGPLTYVFIPRMIWPDKPLVRQGWEYSALVFGKEYTSFSESSTSAGLYSGLYLGWGWTAVILGAAALGALMGMLFRVANRLGGPTLVSLFAFCMIPFALRVDEQWTVGAISGPIISLVFVFAVFRVAETFGNVFSRRRR